MELGEVKNGFTRGKVRRERNKKMAKKRYFWLKLKEDFFRQKEIKKLRKLAGGDTYTIIYLKMLLLAIKNENKLYFEGVEDNFSDELALELDEDEGNVSMTLAFLQKHDLIEVVNDEEYFLPQAKILTGSESESAARVRKHRKKLEDEKKDLLQCNTHVTDSNKNVTTELELEKELELELDLELEKEKEQQLDIDLGEFNVDAVFILNTYLPNLTIKDKKQILNALKEIGGNFYYLEEKIKILNKTENVNSIVGFLIQAIKKDYKPKEK